jgi:hypothetical protein
MSAYFCFHMHHKFIVTSSILGDPNMSLLERHIVKM